MTMLRTLVLLVALGGAAQADPANHALVVGSNGAGPGQLELRYAEDDARRVGAVLAELGGFASDAVDVVVHPTPDVLRQRLDRLSQRAAADVRAGKQVRVFFYYSGHARSTAIDLGPAQLPLDELRARLFGVPATLTVVVLDACQSGAFSRIKGATPAADFSFNSRQHLDAKGVAVLASSSGSELSQESEALRSSYFTHHLLVAMRGAGDTNQDGAVSIDEAYRYAYHQTLVATAATAVGGQHVSLEVDLKGHGEVPLSYPRAATASIELPAALEGHALVQDRRAGAVVAETHKARGAAVRIAVAPGDYDVIVRRPDRLLRCRITAPSTVDVDRCASEAIVTGTRKKSGLWSRFTGPVRAELALQLGSERADGYTETLADFGYHEQGPAVASGLSLAVLRQLDERLWLGLAGALTGSPTWVFENEVSHKEHRWTTASLTAVVRGVQPFTPGRAFGAYAQFAAGLALGHTTLASRDAETTSSTSLGPAFLLGGGLYLGSPYRRGISVTGGYQLEYTRAVDNALDDTHASGGHRITLGLAYSR